MNKLSSQAPPPTELYRISAITISFLSYCACEMRAHNKFSLTKTCEMLKETPTPHYMCLNYFWLIFFQSRLSGEKDTRLELGMRNLMLTENLKY
jgi:hypothetical protein